MNLNDQKYLLRFPPYRSQSWIEENRSLSAVEPSLSDVTFQPKGLITYSHVKAYEIKANSVRREIRNSLFRQALFKIQNIEVLTYKKCKNDRLLLDIHRNKRPLEFPSFITDRTGRALVSEEIWTVDRCGDPQKYRVNLSLSKVRFLKEGADGFNCRVYVSSLSNFLNFVRYYLSF